MHLNVVFQIELLCSNNRCDCIEYSKLRLDKSYEKRAKAQSYPLAQSAPAQSLKRHGRACWHGQTVPHLCLVTCVGSQAREGPVLGRSGPVRSGHFPVRTGLWSTPCHEFGLRFKPVRSGPGLMNTPIDLGRNTYHINPNLNGRNTYHINPNLNFGRCKTDGGAMEASESPST